MASLIVWYHAISYCMIPWHIVLHYTAASLIPWYHNISYCKIPWHLLLHYTMASYCIMPWHLLLHDIITSLLPLRDLHCWFCTIILHSDWVREHQPCFTQCKNKWFCMASFSFQDGRHYEESTTQNGINILNCGLIWTFKYASTCSFSWQGCWCNQFIYSDIVKKLSAKNHCSIWSQ